MTHSDVWVCYTIYHFCFNLEHHNRLDLTNDIHLYAIQCVHIPRINKAVWEFKKGWNRHPKKTANSTSPHQLFVEQHWRNITTSMLVYISPLLSYTRQRVATTEYLTPLVDLISSEECSDHVLPVSKLTSCFWIMASCWYAFRKRSKPFTGGPATATKQTIVDQLQNLVISCLRVIQVKTQIWTPVMPWLRTTYGHKKKWFSVRM